MQIQRLERIPVHFDTESLKKRLRVRGGSRDAVDFDALLREAETIANPRVIFGAAQVKERGADWIELDGTRFSSRILTVNLLKCEQVFPFVCTCGMELETWGRQVDDLLWEFWVEGIKEDALRAALTAFQEHLRQLYNPGHMSTMSPGSLEDWPIAQQAQLFDLLDHPCEVELSDSLLMVPTKSVSGISFAIDANFESCQMCSRDQCPGRRAPYDETLYEREYCRAQA